MRPKTVRALAYREAYMLRKPLKTGLILFAALSTLSILVLLSFYYGNIGYYLRDVITPSEAALAAMTPEQLAEQQDPDELMDMFKTVLSIGVKLYPILMANFMVAEIGKISAEDERKVWQYYYRTLPATPLEKASATYSVLLVLDIAGILISLLFSLLVSAMTGVPICFGDIAFIIAGTAVGNTFGVMMHLGVKLFHSLDKAGIAIFGTLFVAIFAATTIKTLEDANKPVNDRQFVGAGNGIETEIASATGATIREGYNNIAGKIFPIAVILAIGMPMIGFIAYYLICKRREK